MAQQSDHKYSCLSTHGAAGYACGTWFDGEYAHCGACGEAFVPPYIITEERKHCLVDRLLRRPPKVYVWKQVSFSLQKPVLVEIRQG